LHMCQEDNQAPQSTLVYCFMPKSLLACICNILRHSSISSQDFIILSLFALYLCTSLYKILIVTSLGLPFLPLDYVSAFPMLICNPLIFSLCLQYPCTSSMTVVSYKIQNSLMNLLIMQEHVHEINFLF